MARFVITGTGTDIGKTVFAAGLTGLIGADYWKPVQTGVTGHGPAPKGSDAAFVHGMTGARIHGSLAILPVPLSPHRAAELAGVTLEPDTWTLPDADPLVIEGAGGVLVPITRQLLSADLFARWGIPVVLVATTGLGTISHSVTAVESLRARGVPVHGIAFVGDDNPDNIATIADLTGARVLGRLPRLDPLTPDALRAAMQAAFDPQDFT
ncbi:dethiobiotin synthase [Paracoccus sp. MC1862]|uniref:dethiobiotin synthase n=1 Tax=Paracoccus sp. MC1862 TaxID=2760307 RepID=UPI0015FF647B|nr:dethiobiotin synthase [Paracoccus sp. MC1862]MBB1497565.1 dethiobiotin synthase [Paracoccus sp. MC1862]QQO44014.1 dethiobiotin synthase [Paracoccus sp. MC1862]